MKRKNYSEPEKLGNWDTEKVEVRQPTKPSRVVFSVAFSRDDFNLISKYAELCGTKTSKFISEAAIEKATGQGQLSIRGSTESASWNNGEEKVAYTAKHQDLISTITPVPDVG